MRQALLLMVFLAANLSVHAQDAPTLLRDAVSCLSAKEFLPPSKSKPRRFGYWVDTDSYRGEKVLYVVEYENRSFSPGWVFTIFVSKEHGQNIFNIQNNAKFVRVEEGGEYKDVSFPEPPLGGIWTQGHIAKAIRRIARQSSFALSEADRNIRPMSSQCRSYADAK